MSNSAPHQFRPSNAVIVGVYSSNKFVLHVVYARVKKWFIKYARENCTGIEENINEEEEGQKAPINLHETIIVQYISTKLKRIISVEKL